MLAPSGPRFARCASDRRDNGTLFACEAKTTVISTPCAAPAARAMNAPPRCVFERHGVATGTLVTPAVCGHGVIGLLPVIFWTFAPTKLPMSEVITSAAFFAAATSAVMEFGPAGTRSEFAQVPAPGAFNFWSPM